MVIACKTTVFCMLSKKDNWIIEFHHRMANKLQDTRFVIQDSFKLSKIKILLCTSVLDNIAVKCNYCKTLLLFYNYDVIETSCWKGFAQGHAQPLCMPWVWDGMYCIHRSLLSLCTHGTMQWHHHIQTCEMAWGLGLGGFSGFFGFIFKLVFSV
jgi:hypothetical protein